MELAHGDATGVTRKSGECLVNIDQLGSAKRQLVVLPLKRQEQIKNTVSPGANNLQATPQFAERQARVSQCAPHRHGNGRQQF